MILRVLRITLITDPLMLAVIVLSGIASAGIHLLTRSKDAQDKLRVFSARAMLLVSAVKVNAAGLERIPKHGGLVFVANHRSMMDIPVLTAYLPGSVRFLAKQSLFRVPFIGWHLRFGGHVPVVRHDQRAAVKALRQARQIVAEGASVLVFAEGSRGEGDDLGMFKAGAAHIALRSRATVVPVGLRGTQAVLPKGSLHVRPGKVLLRVGEPIRTESFSRRDEKRLTELLQARVRELSEAPSPGDGAAGIPAGH